MKKLAAFSTMMLLSSAITFSAKAAAEDSALQQHCAELVKQFTASCQVKEDLGGGFAFKSCQGDDGHNVTLWTSEQECKRHEVTYNKDHVIIKLEDEIERVAGTSMKTSIAGDMDQPRQVVITGKDGSHLTFTLTESEHSRSTTDYRLDNVPVAKPSEANVAAFFAGKITHSALAVLASEKGKIAENSEE